MQVGWRLALEPAGLPIPPCQWLAGQRGAIQPLPTNPACPLPPVLHLQLRNLGVPLDWSFMEDVRPSDPRFAQTPDDVRYWEQVGLAGGQHPHWRWHPGIMRCMQPPPPTHIAARASHGSAHAPRLLVVQVAALKPQDPLPEDLMHRFYFSCFALLRCGRYADRIAPFLRHFKREK